MTEPPPYLVSYAQNREDLYLWALVGHRPNGTYIDVGCNHARFHSVTRLFYERGWSGLNIDANPAFASEYAERERDTFVASGVAAESGELTLRIYTRGDGLSTFDPYTQEEHERSGLAYREIRVPVDTLTEIARRAGVTRADFLKIDVEGMEADVLRGLDFDVIRPTVIIVEASRHDDCVQLLTPLDYHIEFFDGLNTYFVDNTADDVSIQNYAERVLGAGFRTELEYTLLTRPLEGIRAAAARSVRRRVGRLLRR